jgi:hypothetical protein
MGNVLAEDGRSWGQDWAARFGCCGADYFPVEVLN